MRAIEALRLTLSLDLTPVEKLTLMAVIHSVSWDTWKGQASIMQLASMSGASEKGVRRALEVLTDLKLIGRERRVSRYGEVSATISVNVELLKQFESEAEKHNEIAVGHVDHTLGHVDHTPGHVDRTPGHVDQTPGHVVRREGQHDQAYILSSPVLDSVLPVPPPVHISVFQASPPSETPRETREPEPERTWRTLPPKANAWVLSKQYFAILRGLGHEPDLQLQNALASERVYPEMDDVHSFLIAHAHLID